MTATTSSRTDIGVLADLVEIDQVEKRAAVHKLQLVLTWARAHPGVEGECASWDPQLAGICVDQDGLDHLGGPGTPAVAEFALEQLATRLGVGSFTAMQLVADTLDLPDATEGGVQSASPARRSCLPARLFVHVHLEDLLAHLGGGTGGSGETGIGVVEKLGPATLDLLADWLRETDLSIRPVLDMARTGAVDAHDPPAWMRELVTQRDRHCVFPHCGHDARSCDLDHIDPYAPPDQGGPPGQTHPANLAPLCRRHHRCKTFTRWRYQRSPDGNYQWTDPDGATTTTAYL